jgi:bifunctional DNA-binding transcriptional regulator/antitoxin component of YhaV-PrlF toxin-antitoxin module
MRLQKQLSRKVGSKEYAKWVVVIPPEEVEKAGLKEGDELELEIQKKILRIKRK